MPGEARPPPLAHSRRMRPPRRIQPWEKPGRPCPGPGRRGAGTVSQVLREHRDVGLKD
jgi:hypothetical protein